MAFINGNSSIVTDKLHYYMDPGSKQSYIGSGTSAGSTVGTVPMGTLGASNVFSSDNGGIFNFDGASDYLQVTSNGSTTGFNVNSYTICAWCKPINTGQIYYDVIFSYDYTAHSQPYYAIHFRGYPTNSPAAQAGKMILMWNAAGGTFSANQYLLGGDTSTFTSTSWNMYSATYTHNGSSLTAALYKNGEQLSTATRTQSAPTYYNQEVWLGKANFSTGQYDGGYGPLMFYQKVLTQDEILQNYNALKHRFV